MKQNNRAVALDFLGATPPPSGRSVCGGALYERDGQDGSHSPAVCDFGKRRPKTRYQPDRPRRADGRGSIDARRYRPPAGEEGPAAAQAHPPGCSHVRRASDVQGASGAFSSVKAGRRAGRPAPAVRALGPTNGDISSTALGEIVRAMTPSMAAAHLRNAASPSTRERAVDDRVGICPVEALAVGLARGARQPRADERVGHGRQARARAGSCPPPAVANASARSRPRRSSSRGSCSMPCTRARCALR